MDRSLEYQLNEPIGLEWHNEVIGFDAGDSRWVRPEGGGHLRSQDGRRWPVQFEELDNGHTRVHTAVDLRPNEALHLSLVRGEETANPFHVSSLGDGICISNGVIDVLVPGTQVVQRGVVPGPVVRGRIRGGEWVGTGRVAEFPYVGEVHTDVVASGPVFARWHVRYALGGRTAVRCRCTLFPGADFVWIEDESSTDVALNFDYVLEGDAAPDRLITHGQGEHPQRMSEVLYRTDGRIFHIDFSSGWHQMSHSWCGVYRRGDPTMVGVMEMRGGTWRKVGRCRMEVRESPSRHLTLRAPWSGGSRQWALVFSPVEKNLAAESPQSRPFRSRLGEIHRKWSELPLWKVLGWHLDWHPPAPHGQLRLFGGERIQAIKAFWERFPEFIDVFRHKAQPFLAADEGSLSSHQANALMADYLVTGNIEGLRRARIGVFHGLRQAFANAALGGYHTLIIFDGRSLKLDLQTFDLLDALGHVSAEERSEVCRTVAFLAHCFADRDFFPFELNMLEKADERSWAPELWAEAGDTLCPPNFMTEFITSFGMAACAFPDHPDAPAWRHDAARLFTRQLERHYYDGGAYCESLNYHHHNMVMTTQMALAFRENLYEDFFRHPRFRAQFGTWVDLLTPPVHRNEAGMAMHSPSNSPDTGATLLRMIPSSGNTGRDCSDFPVPAELAMAAAVLQPTDPDLSRRLMRAWREGGRVALNQYNMTAFLLVANPSLPEAEPLVLESKLLHGIGAALRGNRGHPDELYALVKCGWATHHNDKDEGGFCLWAYGAPVSSDPGYHYRELDGTTCGGFMTRLHNCVTFDHKTTALTGQETAFPPERFVTTDIADFLVAHLPVDFLMEPPARSYLDLIPCQHIEYRRFLLFVKPHYFLVYDHIPRNVYTTQWYLHSQARSVDIQGSTARFHGLWGIDLRAQIILPAAPRILSGQFGVQRHIVVEQAGSRDYLAWVAPLRPGLELDVKPGTSPRVIHVTGPNYEDTVLLSPTPFRTEGEGYRFHGRAGVVRRTSGGLNKALLDGEELALT